LICTAGYFHEGVASLTDLCKGPVRHIACPDMILWQKLYFAPGLISGLSSMSALRPLSFVCLAINACTIAALWSPDSIVIPGVMPAMERNRHELLHVTCMALYFLLWTVLS